MIKYFSKPATSYEKQICLLKQRGMEINDEKIAQQFLEYCGYYRFCGYALAFERFDDNGKRLHKYEDGTTFDKIEYIYHFDGALRRMNLRKNYLIF